MMLIERAMAADSGILEGFDKIIPGGFAGFLGFSLQIGLALAFGVFIYAGILFITAGDNSSKVSNAKEWIKSAVVGVIIIASGYILLNTINPKLTDVKDVQIDMIDLPAPEINIQDSSGTLTPGASAHYSTVPLIKQAGGTWGSTYYGNCDPPATYAGSACGPTSLAMAISFLTQTSVSPKTIGDAVVSNGMRVCGSGTTRSAIEYIPTLYGLKSTGVSGKTGMDSCIAGGGVVIGIMRAATNAEVSALENTDQAMTPIFTTGGHFIVITGIDLSKNMVYVNDPGGRNVTSSDADHYLKYNNYSWCVKK